jgi:hypothetical protein
MAEIALELIRFLKKVCEKRDKRPDVHEASENLR